MMLQELSAPLLQHLNPRVNDMDCTSTETLKARKPHRCTNCGESINKGDTYKRWASFGDGSAFTNKMHPECLKDLQDNNGYFEYTLYGGERPSSADNEASKSKEGGE